MTGTCIAAVAIRTTGPDPAKDRLAEIRIEITGADGSRNVAGSAVDAANEPGAAVSRAVAVVPADALWIAHDADRIHTFLSRAAPDAALPDILNTEALSRICFPTLSAYDLAPLCATLGLSRASDDSLAAACANTLRLWDRLNERAAKMQPSLLRELARLLAPMKNHPIRKFFDPAATRAVADEDAAPLRELFSKEAPPPRRQLTLAEVHAPLDPDAVREVFEPHGRLARALAGYEARPQQADMACAVADAFNGSRLLMVEAGTGVGKSLAYLVPAVMWADTNGMPVIVSTSTKNLQSQLLGKDIPLLSRVLGTDFNAVVIKGRRNYLCLRKLLFLLRHAAQELDRRERFMLAAILSWAATSATGDISDCAACAASRDNLNDEITSAGGECHGPQCDSRQRCFLYRARRKALAADIVIANHSVLLAELDAADGSAVLPPHRQLILDEAHNLEEAATSAFSVEVSARRLRFLTSRLWRPGGRKGGHGLLPLLMREFESANCRCEPHVRERRLKLLSGVLAGQPLLWAAADGFFDALAAPLPARAGRETFRIGTGGSLPAQWNSILEAKKPFIANLAAMLRPLDEVLRALEDAGDEETNDWGDYRRQLRSIAEELRTFTTEVDFVLEAADPRYVYWIERLPPRQGGACAWAAPITVGDKLFEMLYAQKDSVVMTSATLSVNGSLAYVRNRLGVNLAPSERQAELVLGSPFDYARQSVVMTPVFLPEPDAGQGGYAEALAHLMADVFRRTRGRALGLFTSYDMLTRTAAAIRPALAGSGIPILVQGESGSREALLEAFKTDGAAVLLGTHSFWEGVDVVGDALSCLVVARLPFAVFTDPIVAARCEQVEAQGDSAFMGFSVPNAVIKLRQGFGRLIRSRDDRGVVIIADRRIVSRRYGRWFQNSLPVPVQTMPDRDTLLAVVESFFETDA